MKPSWKDITLELKNSSSLFHMRSTEDFWDDFRQKAKRVPQDIPTANTTWFFPLLSGRKILVYASIMLMGIIIFSQQKLLFDDGGEKYAYQNNVKAIEVFGNYQGMMILDGHEGTIVWLTDLQI